ncbi:uncharacterized protein LOC117640618 isoform X2 [Thrips palmi]|uniref:Uncharacterized protein LOC117640618 isoform X2 n=1 Tax=Thrips palmi TaxID=161013 RepID=A0A6P8Y918_THRPL|nr:uncharacterized protein LOC117640618 isoform X2 [Thrips palmi]
MLKFLLLPVQRHWSMTTHFALDRGFFLGRGVYQPVLRWTTCHPLLLRNVSQNLSLSCCFDPLDDAGGPSLRRGDCSVPCSLSVRLQQRHSTSSCQSLLLVTHWNLLRSCVHWGVASPAEKSPLKLVSAIGFLAR